jgi:hypothetical protein
MDRLDVFKNIKKKSFVNLDDTKHSSLFLKKLIGKDYLAVTHDTLAKQCFCFPRIVLHPIFTYSYHPSYQKYLQEKQ